jgi:hypothetical protein
VAGRRNHRLPHHPGQIILRIDQTPVEPVFSIGWCAVQPPTLLAMRPGTSPPPPIARRPIGRRSGSPAGSRRAEAAGPIRAPRNRRGHGHRRRGFFARKGLSSRRCPAGRRLSGRGRGLTGWGDGWPARTPRKAAGTVGIAGLRSLDHGPARKRPQEDCGCDGSRGPAVTTRWQGPGWDATAGMTGTEPQRLAIRAGPAFPVGGPIKRSGTSKYFDDQTIKSESAVTESECPRSLAAAAAFKLATRRTQQPCPGSFRRGVPGVFGLRAVMGDCPTSEMMVRIENSRSRRVACVTVNHQVPRSSQLPVRVFLRGGDLHWARAIHPGNSGAEMQCG